MCMYIYICTQYVYIYINGKSPANQLNDKYFVDYQRLTMIIGEKNKDTQLVDVYAPHTES